MLPLTKVTAKINLERGRKESTMIQKLRCRSAWIAFFGALLLLPSISALAKEGLSPASEVPFTQVTVDADPVERPWYKMVGDVTGDGLPDIVIGGMKGPLLAYIAPDWKKHEIAEGGWDGVNGEIADLDGDGDQDVVMGGVLWFENPGTVKQAWTSHQIEKLRLHDIEIADLNADGRLDVIGRDQSAFGRAGNKIVLYYQQNGQKWDRQEIECPHGEGLELGDLDGDNDPDIVIGALWYENPGKPQARWKQHRYTSQWTEPDAKVELADLNADGRPDIVLTPAELKKETYKISWYEAPKSGETSEDWTEHVVVDSIECVIHALGVGDMDNDGDIDFAYAAMHQGQSPTEVVVMLNQEHGTAWQKQVLSEHGSHDIVVADIDADNDLDVVGANHGGDKHGVELWRNETVTPSPGK